MKAFVIYKSEGWHNNGSLLLLFREFGYKIWLRPGQILNYNSLNYYKPLLEQEIEFTHNDIEEMIEIGIRQHHYELLKYKKGAKING